MMRPSERFPPDPELKEDEKRQYVYLIDNYGWAQALSLQQSFLHRKRLNKLVEIESAIDTQLRSLNTSSKRLERATYVLIAAAVILVMASIPALLRQLLVI